MDNKTKMGLGALVLSAGIGVGRLTAAPTTPPVKLVSMTIEPVVGLTVMVENKPRRLQCTDASGVIVKLDGREFPEGKDLCAAAVTFSVGAKASVGMLADKLSKPAEAPPSEPKASKPVESKPSK